MIKKKYDNKEHSKKTVHPNLYRSLVYDNKEHGDKTGVLNTIDFMNSAVLSFLDRLHLRPIQFFLISI